MTVASATSSEATRKTVSIGQALNGSNNSLGLLRLVMAALVIVDHAFPLGGFEGDLFRRFTQGQVSLGGLAVAGFFAISGYLITKSGMSGDVVQFMWRRSLRIFPAYWLVLLVTAFIAAPIVWVSNGDNLADLSVAALLAYLAANWTLNIGSFGIGDLLAGTTPYGELTGGSVFNGSIWTLIYEWNCYLLVAVLVAFGLMRWVRVVAPALAVGFLILVVAAAVDAQAIATLLPLLADPYSRTLGFTFLVGAVLAAYSREVPFDDRLGILAGSVLIGSLRLGGFSTIGTIAGAYFVLYLAARLPRALQRVGKVNDYSYGVYIYGFVVQQLLAHFGAQRFGLVPYIGLALVLSLGCAWVSWHLVEKRAMRAKSWGPGRGARYWLDRMPRRSKQPELGDRERGAAALHGAVGNSPIDSAVIDDALIDAARIASDLADPVEAALTPPVLTEEPPHSPVDAPAVSARPSAPPTSLAAAPVLAGATDDTAVSLPEESDETTQLTKP
ncbi:acyltransferase family protein [Ruicaihuangia caeni]|uniref:acyltransferase family protein n=1 Tax=Ruicaihuangia caeni TaxID=3042517 RepID=UPI00338E8A75